MSKNIEFRDKVKKSLVTIIAIFIVLIMKIIIGKLLLNKSYHLILDYAIKIITIILPVGTAFLAYENYLADRKNRVITENRIEWMYKIRGFIIELDNDLNEYLESDNLRNSSKEYLKIKLENNINKIIIYIGPVKKKNWKIKKRSLLDKELEDILWCLKKALGKLDNNKIREYKKDLIYHSRVYFKLEWEKVKHEALNDSNSSFPIDKEYEKTYLSYKERNTNRDF